MYVIHIDTHGYYHKTLANGDTRLTLKKTVAYKFDTESMAELQANAIRMKTDKTVKVIKL